MKGRQEMAKRLTGKVDNQTAMITGVKRKTGAFDISVKDDDKNVIYERSEEKAKETGNPEDGPVPFEFDFCPDLKVALRYSGALLGKDQEQFLEEALRGDLSNYVDADGNRKKNEKGVIIPTPNEEAIAKILGAFNDDLEAKAQRNAYSKLYQEKKPRSEESVTNTWALMVRGFVANTPGATVQSAIDMFKTAVPNFPSDFTVEKYNAAKLPGRKSGN